MSKKHVVCTLDIDYPKAIIDITLPAMKAHAENISADFIVIAERKFFKYDCT